MKSITSIFLCLSLLLLVGCEHRGGSAADVDATEARQLYLTLLSGEAGADAGSGAAQQRSGWATIRGTVRLDGDPPPPKQLTVNRDTEVCAPGGAAVYSQDVVVGSADALANLVVYARDLSNDNVHPDAQGDASEVIFDQRECIFLSHVQVMQKTQKLKILNSDPVGHNTNIAASKAGTFNQNISPGGSAIYQPVASESQPAGVSCSIHPWMRAYVLPLDNAYGAASEQDGTFEIANLPAGIEIELQFWHEVTGNVPELVINGKSEKLNRGRYKLTLQPDEQLVLDLALPAATLR
ncbi:MAG: hypothetical protein WD030_08230 [Pirellulales bacterium]